MQGTSGASEYVGNYEFLRVRFCAQQHRFEPDLGCLEHLRRRQLRKPEGGGAARSAVDQCDDLERCIAHGEPLGRDERRIIVFRPQARWMCRAGPRSAPKGSGTGAVRAGQQAGASTARAMTAASEAGGVTIHPPASTAPGAGTPHLRRRRELQLHDSFPRGSPRRRRRRRECNNSDSTDGAGRWWRRRLRRRRRWCGGGPGDARLAVAEGSVATRRERGGGGWAVPALLHIAEATPDP